MAERTEEPEAEASPSAAAAADGGTAAGVALALGRTRPAARLAPEAADFLKKQSRLVELQMEHLHEQRELMLSRLRLGRWRDRAALALQAMTRSAPGPDELRPAARLTWRPGSAPRRWL
jgi:hypothetical protein